MMFPDRLLAKSLSDRRRAPSRSQSRCRRSVATPSGDNCLQNLAIDSSPEIAELAADLHEDLIQVPTPLGEAAYARNPPFSDLSSEYRAKPVQPILDCLMGDVDPTLGQEILDVAQRQRVPHVHHHDQTDHFRRAVEISKRVAHGPNLPQPETARKIGLTPPFHGVRGGVAAASAMTRVNVVDQKWRSKFYSRRLTSRGSPGLLPHRGDFGSGLEVRSTFLPSLGVSSLARLKAPASRWGLLSQYQLILRRDCVGNQSCMITFLSLGRMILHLAPAACFGAKRAVGDADCGDDRSDTARAFRSGQDDQGDRARPEAVAQHGAQGPAIGGDSVFLW